MKDHETAAEMFEKSMLYLPRDEENRARRANCYRVLCLCNLGLSRLDQAQEFIDEADKVKGNDPTIIIRTIQTGESILIRPSFSPQLEPNINCAFLKVLQLVYFRKDRLLPSVENMMKNLASSCFDNCSSRSTCRRRQRRRPSSK